MGGGESAPVRILHVVTRSQRRGAELAAVELADELDRRGHHNRLVALGAATDGSHVPGVVPLGRSRRDTGAWALVTSVWRLRRHLASGPVDVVLAHGGWAAQIAALASPRGGPLLVWQRISELPEQFWGRVRRRWWGVVARRVDVAVALTGQMAGDLERLGFRGPVWIIPNFRNPDRFLGVDRAAAAARLRAEIGVPESGTRVIGFVGHLGWPKRPERALDVLAALRDHGRPAHLVVAGDGPQLPELEKRAGRLGLGGAVTFLGQRDDVEWVFGGIDLALLTSASEGVPGVAIEAMMAGCPMVTVPVGGVAEVVEDGVTGRVLEDDDPASMAAAVAGLLDDDELRDAMGRSGRLRASSYSVSATAAIYAERLATALDERGGDGRGAGRGA